MCSQPTHKSEEHFARLADHLNVLASEIARAIAAKAELDAEQVANADTVVEQFDLRTP